MSETFDPVRHEYRLDGRVVPSVTQLLTPIQDWSGIPKSVLEAKAILGTAVHRACELDEDGLLDEETLDERIEPYLRAFKKFKAEKRPKLLANEKRLFHLTLGYAGTLDRLYEIDGWPWIIDLKTAVAHNPWVGVQLAGYVGLVEASELKPEKAIVRGGLNLRPDGTYRLHPCTDPTDWPTFVSLLTLHNWRQRHAA